jgi:putative oxidoreductase
MSIFEPAPSPWPVRMLSVFRIVAAAVFISVGSMKLFGFPPPPSAMPPITPMTQLWIAGVLEVYGGAAILLGLFTRPVAFVLYCFLWLYLAVAGAGAWSLDAMIARSKGGGPA